MAPAVGTMWSSAATYYIPIFALFLLVLLVSELLSGQLEISWRDKQPYSRFTNPHIITAACVHGYLSAADRSTCICNSGWIGPNCEVDALPSCNRGAGQPCVGDLRFSGVAENQSCACVTECVEHTQEMLVNMFGIVGINFSASSPLRLHPSLLDCEHVEDYISAGYVREATEREIEPEGHNAMKTNYTDCYTNCLSAPGHNCSAHFCECPPTRAGAFCQSRLSRDRLLGTDDGLLTFQILEVPGALLMDRVYESLYHMRSDYWGVPYFWEQLIRDPEVFVDDNASVIIIPYMADPGTSAELWIKQIQRYSGALPHLERPVMYTNAQPTLVQAPVYEGWFHPNEDNPQGSIYLQNNGRPDEIGARMDIAMPLHDFELMPDIRGFRRMGPNANLEELGRVAQLQEMRRQHFNVTRKSQLELFFVGRTKVKRAAVPMEPSLECLDERLFTASAEQCKCLVKYSECVRQYLYYNYRESPGMYLRDPKLDKMNKTQGKYHRIKFDRNTEESGIMMLQHSSAFCLVAGGCNFDMRIESAILGGCIPFWTFLEQIPPLPRVLKHERFMVRLTPETRPALAYLEALLGCYTPDVREELLANMEMTWPAYSWGTGTAYQHSLLEIAALTNKRVPSAMGVILQIHGPKYVGQMLKVDLEQYASLSGMDEAIRIRQELMQSDPLAEKLQAVEQCVYALPGVGNRESVAAAAEFIRIRRTLSDKTHQQPL